MLRDQIEKRLLREARDADGVVRWQQLCNVFSRCGLVRLTGQSVRESMLCVGLAPMLNGPPLGIGSMLLDRKQVSVLHALSAFLDSADGESSTEDGSRIAAALKLTRGEAAALHRELVREHFMCFVQAALPLLETKSYRKCCTACSIRSISRRLICPGIASSTTWMWASSSLLCQSS